MNFRIFIPLSLVLLSFWLKAAAQTNTNGNCLKTFQNKYHNNDDNTALSIVDAGNGQFYVAGNSVSSGSSDILITKHSADGSILWAKKYGAAGDETVRRIKLANDGGLLIIGQTKSFTNSNGDILCLKISATGLLIWSRKFGVGSTFGDLGMDIIQATDNSYVFTGILNVTGTLADMLIVKLDVNANILWSQRFDSEQGENGVGLLQKGDTLIVTSDIDNNVSDFNGLISKIKLSDGKPLVTKKIRPDSRNLYNSCVFRDNADGYWISGHTIDQTSYVNMQQIFLHFDVNFKLIQTYKLDLKNNIYSNDYYTGFVVKSDGFITCAGSASNPVGYFFYIKNDGSIKMAKKFSGTTGRELYGLLNANGKIISVGKERSSGKNNLFIAEFGEDGLIDEKCHPDTALLTVSNPLYSITDLNWKTVNDQQFPDITAPLTTTDATLTSSSLCDACEVETVTASFTAPDTVCVNTSVKITNTTKGATNYYWNFCEPDINSNPTAVNIGNPGGYLSQPVFSDLAEYNGNYYAFVVNYQPGGLLRLDFGSSYLNTPTPVFLGNVGGIMNSNYGSEGIQVVKNNGRWYAIIVGGSPINAGSIPKLLKIDFGPDLTNANPVATDWGNVGDLLQSIDLYLFQENSKWYGFAANSENNTLTRFDFSSSFSNTPIGTNLGNVSGVLNYPTGICAIKDNGNWYVFVGNGLDNSIVRLDFGNSLLNTPVAKNIGNPGNLLYQPRDITILKYCGSIIGFVVDTQNNLTRLDFNNDITSIPVAMSLGNIGDFDFSHSLSKIFRAGPDLYSFVTNVSNNTITRIRFPGCNNSSISNFPGQNPPDVTYNKPGIYNINLSVDDGLPTQASYCKQVVALPAPEKKPVIDTSFCRGDSIILKAASTFETYTWNTGSTDSSIMVNDAGTYWVDINYYGCKARDSIVTTFKMAPYVFLGNDTAICNHDSLTLDAGNSGLTYLWQDGSSLNNYLVRQVGLYNVKVTNANGCSSRDSIRIDSLESPRVFMKDTTICIGNTIMLNAQSTGNNNYQWQVSPTLSAVNIPNPVATPLDTSTYFVVVSNANNCKTKDSIKISVVPQPTVTAMADTSLCYGSTFTLSVTGTNTNHYGWSPSQGLSDVTLQNPSGTLLTNIITYTVTAYNDGCSVSDNVKLTALPLPTLALTYRDTTICIGGQAQLNASGNGNFVWSPAIAINDTTSATPIVNPVTPTWYHVKITSANTCINNDSVFVAVNPKPVFEINPKQPSICIGDSVLITASGGDVYTWSPVTSVKNPYGASSVVYPSKNTMYEVTITNNTCHVTESVFANVTVTTKPEITIKKSNDIDCFIGSAKLEATGGSKFLWSPSATLSNTYGYTTIARLTETTTYYVEVTKNGSCKATDSIQVKVIKDGAQNGYFVPTAFTPNGDMRNDCFGVKNWGVVTNFDFSVYNRWGERIFYTRNASDCWNGMYKSTLQPPGAYVYQIRAKTLCGDVYRKGTIVLIR